MKKHRITLEEIVRLRNAKNKEYTIPKGGLSISFNAVANNAVYYGRKQISERYNAEPEVQIDKNNLPFYRIQVGDITCDIHDSRFIEDYGIFAAMGKLHEKYLADVFEKIKSKNHPLYNLFRKSNRRRFKEIAEECEGDDDTDITEIESQVFVEWYEQYLKQQNYDRLVTDYEEKAVECAQRYAFSQAEKLRRHGFKRVEKFTSK